MDFFGQSWSEILPFIAIGFGAQLVDGALGMAFGSIATSLLIGLAGFSPAQASYQVHAIKSLTTAATGLSHTLSGNVDKRIFIAVVFTGILGGVVGALILGQVDGDVIKPFVLGYLAVIGLILFVKGIRRATENKRPAKGISSLGFVGGVLDAIGGGGWGPVVSSGLMLQGIKPRIVVGSVNAAEFFVVVAISAALISQFGIDRLAWATVGLLIGGVVAAPFGAIAAKYLPASVLLTLVGFVLTVSSTYWLIVSLL